MTTDDFIERPDFDAIRADLRRQADHLQERLQGATDHDIGRATGDTVLAIARAMDALLADTEHRQ